MKTLNIALTRKIVTGKKVNGVAKTVNIMVIDLPNGQPSIVRKFSQFLQDLKNSYLIDENVMSINHPDVTDVLPLLNRGKVTGEITFSKKGDTWTVTPESSCITDPTHADFGKCSVGDTRVLENDGAYVDGFLLFEVNAEARADKANAKAYSRSLLAQAGAFDDFGTVSATSHSDDNVDDDVPESILQEAIAPKKAVATPK